MGLSATSPATVLELKKAKQKYPEARVIVLDDNFNTFNMKQTPFWQLFQE